MKKIKVLYCIWAIIVIAIISLLTLIGYKYKENTNKYKKAENNFVKYVKIYADEKFIYPDEGESIKVKLEDLQKDGKVRVSLVCDNAGDVTCEKCDGYVKITKKGVYKYKAYIKCENYTTKGY